MESVYRFRRNSLTQIFCCPERRLMKVALIFLLLASGAVAQNLPAAPTVPPSCGSIQVSFDVKPDRHPHSLGQPDPGKALVYVFEEFQEASGGFMTPTIRLGLDGDWAGATRGSSFLFFSVAPGEHHLCANWQSSYSEISNQYSLTSFSAESGKVYFFRVAPRVESFHDRGNAWSKDLALVDRDEANYLIGISSLSTWRPHK
jgi:hypothetical protein